MKASTNFNMALGFYSSLLTPHITSIMFYVEYRKSVICCFRGVILSPYNLEVFNIICIEWML